MSVEGKTNPRCHSNVHSNNPTQVDLGAQLVQLLATANTYGGLAQ